MQVFANNLFKLLPGIVKTIESADFIAIDLEFTGIFSSRKYNNSITDTEPFRVNKFIQSTRNYAPLQVGITPFKINKSGCTFYPINMTLNPATAESDLVINSSTMEFMKQSHYCFNNGYYNGIHYAPCDKHFDNDCFEQYYNNTLTPYLAHFNSQKEKTALFSLPPSLKETNLKSRILRNFKLYVMMTKDHEALISKNQIDINLITSKERTTNNNTKFNDKQYIKYGASEIFNIIEKLEKPIVLHNGIIDSIMIARHFISDTIKDSESLRNLFTSKHTIYDTKHIAKSDFNFYNMHTSLSDLYHQCLPKMLTKIKIDKRFNYELESAKYHEAGFDSLMTAVCFYSLLNNYCASYGVNNGMKIFSQLYENKIRNSGFALGYGCNNTIYNYPSSKSVYVIHDLANKCSKRKIHEIINMELPNNNISYDNAGNVFLEMHTPVDAKQISIDGTLYKMVPIDKYEKGFLEII